MNVTSTIHIYRTQPQPATSWSDSTLDGAPNLGWAPDELIGCECCRRQRPAKDCVVYVYYDYVRVVCGPGKGCKDPHVIADRRAQQFANRSAGQRARWARNKRGEA